MMTSNAAERVRLLQASLRQVRRHGQYLGSGATVHLFVNQISTAYGALRLAEARCAAERHDDLETLLDLAEDALRAARVLASGTTSRNRRSYRKTQHAA